MLRRLISHLSYANVIATVAVFLALAGGGYALATIQGHGRVSFGGQKGLSDGSFATILNLPGIGKVQGRCGMSDSVRFKNTSGRELQATVSEGAVGDFEAEPLSDGASLSQQFHAFDGLDTVRFHVYRAGTDGTPMAEITASHKFRSGCASNAIAVQAVSSD